jgi:hypothetical protein
LFSGNTFSAAPADSGEPLQQEAVAACLLMDVAANGFDAVVEAGSAVALWPLCVP